MEIRLYFAVKSTKGAFKKRRKERAELFYACPQGIKR
jgi:hypothetical protein